MNTRHPADDEALLQRVYGEFLEMPGLRLTRQQAQRLLGLDERTCADLLEFLVAEKLLYRTRDGMYTTLTDGDSPRPRSRGVRAQVASDSAHQ